MLPPSWREGRVRLHEVDTDLETGPSVAEPPPEFSGRVMLITTAIAIAALVVVWLVMVGLR
jgi:hypothetical protein